MTSAPLRSRSGGRRTRGIFFAVAHARIGAIAFCPADPRLLAVRVLYDDESLHIIMGAMGSAPDATYQFVYGDGRLSLLRGERR